MVRKLPVSPIENERSFQLDSMNSFEAQQEPTKPLRPREMTRADTMKMQRQHTMQQPNLVKKKRKEEEEELEKARQKEIEEEKEKEKERKEKIRDVKKAAKKTFVFLVNKSFFS